MTTQKPNEIPFLGSTKSSLVSAILFITFTVGYWLYDLAVSFFLFKQSGGVKEISHGWTQYGGASHAWITALDAPAMCLNFALDGVGTLACYLIMPCVFGYSLFRIVILLSKHRSLFEAKLAFLLVILGLIWVPVPEQLSLAFQLTTRY